MASSRLPQECWNEIVSKLDTAELKACALTGSLLFHPAQAVLFRDITVMHPKDAAAAMGDDTFLTSQEDRAYTIAAYTRLHSVLATSPHLKMHIRVVELTAYVDSIAIVTDMDLPRLADITLVGSDERPALDGPLVPHLTRLIALPSLRRLNLQSDFDPSILADCSSHLEEFVLDGGVRPRKPWVEWAPNPARTRLVLKRLYLQQVREKEEEDDDDDSDDEDESARGALAWLLHPYCPFVLTGVEELAIFGPMTGYAHLLLQLAASSIQRLEMGPNESIEQLDLAPLTALHSLRLHITKANDMALLFAPLLRLVETTDTNNIRTIYFDVAEFSAADINAEVEAELGSFYGQVKQLHQAGSLPSLQLLGFPVLPEPWGRDPAVHAMFQRAMSVVNPFP